jgi:CBS domain-containing protein
MAQQISELMTPDPVTCEMSAPITDAARVMRDNDIGAIIVTENDEVRGIVTDRDIVVRGLADGADPQSLHVGDVCSASPETVSPTDPVDRAIELVRGKDVRRIPVVEDGRPVGIVSIGDLAIERDGDSALADISSAPANS